MSLQVITGGKNRPFEVSGINSDEDHPDPAHETELVIVHRDPTPGIVMGQAAEIRAVVAGPVSLADRDVAEAFCKAMNDFHQYQEEFDWDHHDMDQPMPPFPGAAA